MYTRISVNLLITLCEHNHGVAYFNFCHNSCSEVKGPCSVPFTARCVRPSGPSSPVSRRPASPAPEMPGRPCLSSWGQPPLREGTAQPRCSCWHPGPHLLDPGPAWWPLKGQWLGDEPPRKRRIRYDYTGSGLSRLSGGLSGGSGPGLRDTALSPDGPLCTSSKCHLGTLGAVSQGRSLQERGTF